jgi:hypothetical protein
LFELRATDRAFTIDEVGACLAARGIDLPLAAVRTLHERTEGWVAGVRIAILALTSPGATVELVDEFDGDDHAVADYLVTEVLARLPVDTRRFLLETGVCATLDVGLARHLTGRRDAADLLARLERENVFTVRLGREREVYRYHELFRAFLRAELVTGPGITAILDWRGRELTSILERLGPSERTGPQVVLVGAAAALAIEDHARADRWLEPRPPSRRRWRSWPSCRRCWRSPRSLQLERSRSTPSRPTSAGSTASWRSTTGAPP